MAEVFFAWRFPVTTVEYTGAGYVLCAGEDYEKPLTVDAVTGQVVGTLTDLTRAGKLWISRRGRTEPVVTVEENDSGSLHLYI
jgi:hypothetical protein